MSSNDKAKKWSLPPEAKKFAKQMGVDMSGLEPEAMQIWKHLEKLSLDNPVEYERFISEQMQAAKEEPNSSQSNSNAGRSFRPTADFSIQTKSCSGDGAIIRDIGSTYSKVLYINICSSNLIEEPKDKFNKPIPDDRQVADGFQIPLVIGPLRKIDNDTNAVDVIVHPKITKISKQEKYFKKQIIDLSFDWIEQERDVKFDRKQYVELQDKAYCGGLGDAGDIPVLFQVTEDMLSADDPTTSSSNNSSNNNKNTQQSTSDEKKKSAKPEELLSSTKSLLSQLNKSHQDEEISSLNPTMPIQLNTSVTSSPPSSSTQSKPSQSKKLIIEEIGGPSKVVEENHNVNSDANIDQTEKAVRDKKVSFEIQEVSISTTEPEPIKSSHKPLSKFESQQCQELLAQCDPDFADDRMDYFSAGDKSASILGDLARAFGVQDSSSRPSPDHTTITTSTSTTTAKIHATKNAEEILLINAQPTVIHVDAALSKGESSNNMILTVNVNGLKDNADPASFELEASENVVKIVCQLKNFTAFTTNSNNNEKSETETVFVRYQGGDYVFDKQKIKASYRKKAKRLIISVGCIKTSK